MYAFSFIIILYWVFNLVRNDPKKAFLNQFVFSIFISIFIEVGNFLNSDIIKIENWQMVSILTFFNALLLQRKVKITNRFFFFILFLIVNIIVLIIMPYKKPVVVGAGGIYEEVMSGNASYVAPFFSKFTVFFLILSVIQAYIVLVAYSIFSRKDLVYIIRKLSIGVKFIIVIVGVEIIFRYLIDGTIYNSILTTIFGTSPSTYTESILRGSGYMLQGLTREGSHFVYSSFTSLIILFIESKISPSSKKKNMLYVLICVAEIFMSMSFTTVLIFVMLLLIYTVYNYNDENSRRFKRIFILTTIILVAIFQLGPIILSHLGNGYYSTRFLSSFEDVTSIINSKSDITSFYSAATISSTTTRIFSVIDALSTLAYRPLFGLGLGTNFCHGSTALTLSEIGILGLFFYVRFYFYSFKTRNKNFKIKITMLVIIWLIANTFVSGPRLTVRLDSYVMFICFYFLFEEKITFLNSK